MTQYEYEELFAMCSYSSGIAEMSNHSLLVDVSVLVVVVVEV